MIPPTRFLPLGLAAWFCLGTARASNKYLEVPPASVVQQAPAYQHANLSDAAALAELIEREVPFAPVQSHVKGVRAPVRLTGPLHGVSIHSALPESRRQESPYEILDARLALALDDFCELLHAHDIVEVVHYTMYRPGGGDEPAFRHPGGLAIDVGRLKKSDGTWLDVAPHWSRAIGARTCGRGARIPKNERGKELSHLVCLAAGRRLFTYMLTPHFDRHHHDHLHLELKPGVRWFLVN